MTSPSVRWVPTAPTESVASARLRCYRPAAALARAGWDSVVVVGRRPVEADVVVFQKAYSSRHLALAARLRRQGTAVVLDLCDNHFYNPGGNRVLSRRADRLRHMIGLAHVVTASTPAMADLVCHPCVQVVDDSLDVERPVRSPAAGPGHRLIWFGNAGSQEMGFGMGDLGAIVGDLETLARSTVFELMVLSNSKEAFERHVRPARFTARYESWTPEGAEAVLRTADVALLPVTLNPFTLCKTSNRVTTALQQGLAVVAGQIPSYGEFAPYLRFGGWTENVGRYLADGGLRADNVTRGQAYISRRFPPERLVQQWTTALRTALDHR